MTTRKGFIALDPRAWRDDNAVRESCERFVGHALIVTTFPVPAAFVRVLREETGAKIVGYFDPMHIPVPGTALDPARADLNAILEDAGLYVRRARDGSIIVQYPDRGLYVHNEETAAAVGRWLAERIAEYGLDGYFLDNLGPKMSDWLLSFYADAARPSRVLRWGTKIGTANTLSIVYAETTTEVAASIRECVGDSADRPILIANSGMAWRNSNLDGLCFEDGWNVGSWQTSLPPYVNPPRARFDCGYIRDDADKERRESLKLPTNALRLYQGAA